ncbi:hypothetical protein BDY21DRAFT_181720 [Lineolata rhizophorae]|uniref:Uncharacterized protein n=1 Tax=Lineolata rhizophorae TaxID=578093 RepID=A0A6A6P7K4_9PEZI|nr:hypothetical protein BDY21DRAFT_181720 [Lineolata rhizophorae]
MGKPGLPAVWPAHPSSSFHARPVIGPHAPCVECTLTFSPRPRLRRRRGVLSEVTSLRWHRASCSGSCCAVNHPPARRTSWPARRLRPCLLLISDCAAESGPFSTRAAHGIGERPQAPAPRIESGCRLAALPTQGTERSLAMSPRATHTQSPPIVPGVAPTDGARWYPMRLPSTAVGRLRLVPAARLDRIEPTSRQRIVAAVSTRQAPPHFRPYHEPPGW